jgi:hypothetical protein
VYSESYLQRQVKAIFRGRDAEHGAKMPGKTDINTWSLTEIEKISVDPIYSAKQTNTESTATRHSKDHQLSHIMHFSLPLTIAAASLCTAAPLANTDNPTLEKRTDISGATPFWSGETMNFDQIQEGVD